MPTNIKLERAKFLKMGLLIVISFASQFAQAQRRVTFSYTGQPRECLLSITNLSTSTTQSITKLDLKFVSSGGTFPICSSTSCYGKDDPNVTPQAYGVGGGINIVANSAFHHQFTITNTNGGVLTGSIEAANLDFAKKSEERLIAVLVCDEQTQGESLIVSETSYKDANNVAHQTIVPALHPQTNQPLTTAFDNTQPTSDHWDGVNPTITTLKQDNIEFTTSGNDCDYYRNNGSGDGECNGNYYSTTPSVPGGYASCGGDEVTIETSLNCSKCTGGNDAKSGGCLGWTYNSLIHYRKAKKYMNDFAIGTKTVFEYVIHIIGAAKDTSVNQVNINEGRPF